MAQTYLQLQAQIARLQVEAESLRHSERTEVIAKIQVAIAAYDLTQDDLFGGNSKKQAAMKKSAATKSKAQVTTGPKFSDDKGNSWVGRGKRPQWLRQALQAGRELSEFVVQGVTSPSKAKTSPKKVAKMPATKSNGVKKSVAAKFRDESGNTWSGRGSQPRWLRDAVAAGKALDQFAV